ncbi:MAG TPA: peptide-N-glycosidase F-related protein [Polyangiaceae bacterium]
MPVPFDSELARTRPFAFAAGIALATLACGSDPEDVRGEPEPTRVVPVFHNVRVSSVQGAENFQHAVSSIDFGRGPFARATLSVNLESPCFPFDKWTPESIPEGHLFPPLCDGFDRTFLLSLDDPADPAAGPPGLELARAITPFGGPLRFDIDLTDVANGLPGEHVLHADIQTWGDRSGLVSGAEGEWLLSARIVLEPGPAPRSVLAVAPMAFGIRTNAGAEPFSFDVPEGTASARLEYRTTGHGGAMAPDDTSCAGPAEEFCQRTHTLSLDGEELAALVPWRADCDTLCTLASYESDWLDIPEYCEENPIGLPASVRAPRANWCPGSVTPPFVLEPAELAVPGEHELTLELDALAEGGQWVESLVLFAYE